MTISEIRPFLGINDSLIKRVFIEDDQGTGPFPIYNGSTVMVELITGDIYNAYSSSNRNGAEEYFKALLERINS